MRGYILYFNSTVVPSNETITITIYRATGASTLNTINTSTFTWGGTNNRIFSVSGLATTITAGDTYEFQIQIPLMATNPTNVVLSGVIDVELT